MFAEAIFSIILLGLPVFAASNGDTLNVTISADPPLGGLIYVGKIFTFTCKVPDVLKVAKIQYQWSIGGGQREIGTNTYSLRVSSLSTITVTCEVYVHDVSTQYDGMDTVIVQPTAITPQIYFQYMIDNFWIGMPFNLTATIVSNLNLTSLHWSPPKSSVPKPSRTITVHHGNLTTTTYMLLEDATLSDSGNYTLTAVNECGQSSLQVNVEVRSLIADCPLTNFTAVQPTPNFMAVEGYNATMKCSYDGYYSLASPLRVWVLFPHSQKPEYIDDWPYYDCNCWMENRLACPIGTDPNDCCRFELIMHSTPVLKENGTVFSCTKIFSKDTTWMFVVPSPKVLEPPCNVNTTVGSKAVFTCHFEASTDNKIAQIHWEFNGTDLAGCKRFQHRISCTVTQNSTDTNYISSTLEIYSVQADNAGQYTCYCSYNTSILNVDDVQIIQSDHKSATLSVQSGPEIKLYTYGPEIKLYIAIGISTVAVMIIFIVLLYYCGRVHYKIYQEYERLPGRDISSPELTDEILDQYITEELFPFWEKLGKALKVQNRFLEEDLPADPAERLKTILREWRTTGDHPSVSTLNKKLEQLGLKDFIPE